MEEQAIPRVIGANVRAARTAMGWTQAKLAHLMNEGGGHWRTRQTAYEAEQGRRDFKASELAVLARVLDRPVSWFFQPQVEEWSPQYGAPLGDEELSHPAHLMEVHDAIASAQEQLRAAEISLRAAMEERAE